MKKSLIALALMCVAACAGWIGSAAGYVADVVVATGRAFKNLVLDGFKLAAANHATLARPLTLLVQAKAFVLRLAKRERPVKSTAWSMCPST